MLEALKGISLVDSKFLVPIIIVVCILFIVVKVAKKLVKLAVFICIIAIAVTMYFNMPAFKVDGAAATLKLKGHEYRIDTKNVKLQNENHDGKEEVYLISGTEKIKLPFSREFAQKFIVDKLNKK